MPILPEFSLTQFLSRYERAARFPMSSSYAETITLDALLAMATEEQRAAFAAMPLDYPPFRGSEALREAIAASYQTVSPHDVLAFAGADEALYVAFHALLDREDHAIVLTPGYQSLESVPLALCQTSALPLRPENDWALDLDELRRALRPTTKLLVVGFPHNPTGLVPPRDTFQALVTFCREHRLWLLSDEVYRLTEWPASRRLPQAVDRYERAISVNVLSKSLGLPGLRIGWIACRDRALIERMGTFKQYLSVCNAAPAEALAVIALGARERILGRTRAIAEANLAELDAIFAEHPEQVAWRRPNGGLVGFPAWRGPGTVEAFSERLAREHGILVVPASAFSSALAQVPAGHFRIGFGRRVAAEGFAALRAALGASHLAARGSTG